MIKKNPSGLAEVDFELQNKGLSFMKLLKKNNINSICIEFEETSYSQFKFGFQKDIALVDVISLCDLIAKFSYKTSDNFYITWRKTGYVSDLDYNQLINTLLLHDLNGMYLIEENQIAEREGAIKIVGSSFDDTAKKMFLDYYNPLSNHETKKELLSNISNLFEPLKPKLPKDKSKIYDKTLTSAMNSFMEIVNTIDGIRHSNNRTQTYSEEIEVELMDIALNHAITLLKYKAE